MKLHYLLAVILICFIKEDLAAQIQFQSTPETYRIRYASFNNGKPSNRGSNILVYTNANQTLLTNEKDYSGAGSFPLEMTLIDRSNLAQQMITLLSEDASIATTDTASIKSQHFQYLDDTKTILGFACKKAKTIVNSNTIEFWYTQALPVKGAPTALGQDLGLVLEMVRNGNAALVAQEVKKVFDPLPAYFKSIHPKQLDLLSYKDEIWRSRFQSIPLFKDQIINFSKEDTTAPPEVMRFANGTIVVRKIKFPELDRAKNIFIELKEQSNGDAYDRTGTVFLIPTEKQQSFLDGLKNGVNQLPVYENGNGKKYQGVVSTANFDPAIELMRFFTPFGIKGYNHIELKGKDWHEVVPYRQDISDFASVLSGNEIYIGVFIGNYDKGGHKITAEITLHPGGRDAPKKVIPLFNTLNIMEMAGQEYATMFDQSAGLVVNFELKEPAKNAVLRYTTTGHGGWGNGDEFVPKENTVLLDNKVVFKMVPWREDCGSYRLFNPASGNFSSGLSSSDLSRSNWCPGTVTNPYIIQLGDLPAGKHTIQVKIPQGEREGKSFSAWNVSGAILAD
ncbi:PNGase F N-terminal domain-containing protein [Niabella insulamsoli]|uniref:PNGase F N-terminal domain-containing protein n=1 Tax=Niabella insulamsoli TaxID=3144874 RepID=UPI0031FD0961